MASNIIHICLYLSSQFNLDHIYDLSKKHSSSISKTTYTRFRNIQVSLTKDNINLTHHEILAWLFQCPVVPSTKLQLSVAILGRSIQPAIVNFVPIAVKLIHSCYAVCTTFKIIYNIYLGGINQICSQYKYLLGMSGYLIVETYEIWLHIL